MADALHILHTADLHLGRNRKYADYLHQQRRMLSAIVSALTRLLDEAAGEDVWFVLAGDVFDRNQDTKRDELALFLIALAAPILDLLDQHTNLQVFWIDGNHDRQPNAEEPSVLTPLLGLVTHSRFHIALVKPKYVEECRMLMVPFGKYSESELSDLISQNMPDFVMAHECFARIQTDTGWEPPRNQDHYVEINNLPRVCKGIFLGDIHRSQCLDDEDVAWYCGSPVTLDFGHSLPKGLLHHKFVKDGQSWKRDGKPVLKALDDPEIRQHYQVGVVTDVKDIPWSLVTKKNAYVDLVVSPEVYEEIKTKSPTFFDSSNVSWGFPRVDATVPDISKPATMEDYYRPLRDTWIEENLVNLSAELQDVCKQRVQKDFETRG